MWLVLGIGYGLLLPPLTGALLPLSIVFINLTLGVIELGELPSEFLEALFRSPLNAIIYGSLAIVNGCRGREAFSPQHPRVDLPYTGSYTQEDRGGQITFCVPIPPGL